MSLKGDIVQAICGPALLASGSAITSSQSSSTRTRSCAGETPAIRHKARNAKRPVEVGQETAARRTADIASSSEDGMTVGRVKLSLCGRRYWHSHRRGAPDPCAVVFTRQRTDENDE